VELKSKFKPACKKIWKAFNSWRKRGMWFRLTVLLIIGSVPLTERLITTDHVPLINELVLIACKAIRCGSEPKVTSAHLRYLHIKKSRQLQNKLQAKVKDGNLHLNPNEMKLLSQNTLNANYNKLFALAKRAKLIPTNITLSQTKRAMLNESLKLTAERFGTEWEEVQEETKKEYHFHRDVLLMKLRIFWYGIMAVLPLPIIPTLPWFVLCLTLGFWGAGSKHEVKWVFSVIVGIFATLVWIYVIWLMRYNSISKIYQRYHEYGGLQLGISTFFAIWVLIAGIWAKRLYNYMSKRNKEKKVLIALLVISGIILLIPETCFEAHNIGWAWWVLPGYNLLFKNSSFAPYFVTVGVGVLLYALFLILKNYAQKLEKYKWTLFVKYLVIVLLLAKLVYSWYFYR